MVLAQHSALFRAKEADKQEGLLLKWSFEHAHTCCDAEFLVQGFLGVMFAGQILFYFLFKLGKLIRRLLQYVRKRAEYAVSQRDLNVKAE